VKLITHLHLVPRSRMRGIYPHSLNTPSWRGAQLKHRDDFFTLSNTVTYRDFTVICYSDHVNDL
jgi:hypothetical protein